MDLLYICAYIENKSLKIYRREEMFRKMLQIERKTNFVYDAVFFHKSYENLAGIVTLRETVSNLRV